MPLSIPDQTIAAQVKVPDMMNSLNSIMQYRNAQQTLQTNQLDYDIKDKANQKLNALRDLAASPDMTKADGSFDNAGFAGQAGKIDPVQGQEMAGKALSNQSAGIGNEKNQFALHKDYTDTALQTAAGLMQDPRITAPDGKYDPEQASTALSEGFSQMVAKGVPVSQALLATAPFVNAVHQPGAVRQMLSNTVNGKLSDGGQAAQNLIPASSQQAPASDTAGNPAIQSKDQFGNVQPLKSQPIAGQLTPTMPSGPLAFGEKDRIAPLAQEVMAAKNSAMNAQLLHTTNQGILHEIDHVSATGVAGPTFQKINSYLGGVLDFSTAEKKASSYDMVGKYLEKNALTAAAGMGPQTNAGLEAQIKANGSVGYNPTAIKAITKLNDALVSGSEAYAPGLKKAMDNNPTRGVLAKEQYDEQWGKVFKPEVMQLYNAAKSGDAAEKKRIIDAAGGANSAGVKDLVMRAQGIQSLMKTGQLPPNFGLK